MINVKNLLEYIVTFKKYLKFNWVTEGLLVHVSPLNLKSPSS